MKLHRYIVGFLVLVLLLVAAATSHAQTGACPTGSALSINPNGWVCMTVVAGNYDGTTTVSGGPSVPIVTRVDFLLFDPTKTNTASDTPTQTIPVGVPTKNAQDAAWFQVPALLALPVGQTYKARVQITGQPSQTGSPVQVSVRSPESNPFMRAAPSTAPLAPTAVSVPD